MRVGLLLRAELARLAGASGRYRPNARRIAFISLSLVLLLTGLACQPAPNPGATTAAPAVAQATPTLAPAAESPAQSTPDSSPTADPSPTSPAPPREPGARGLASAAPSPATPPSPAAAPVRREGRTIVLDAGHGLPDYGAVNQELTIWESKLVLDIAKRAADLLREAGYQVVLTRETEDALDPVYRAGDYSRTIYLELQRRVDIANATGADLFFSLHANGSDDPEMRGIEVWYNIDRTFADRNKALGEVTLENIVAQVREAGYPLTARGLYADPYDDPAFKTAEGRPTEYYVLEAGTHPERRHEPTHMPGIVVEHVFMSYLPDAQAINRPEIRQAIARGYLAAVDAYFERFPE